MYNFRNIQDALVAALESEYDAIDMYTKLANMEHRRPDRRDRFAEILLDEQVHARMLERYVRALPRSAAYPITLSGAIQSERDAIQLYSKIIDMTSDPQIIADLEYILADEQEHLRELQELW